MRRNALYIILSLITILFLFIIAATCSFCGMQLGQVPTDETKIDVEDNETVSEETEKDGQTSRERDYTDSEDTGNTAPTISLAILEGPTYSEADDICYYRIKATISGSPVPNVSWSTDYSNGSLGNTIAQVNLTRDDLDYTLTATATNSEGSATDSIDLSWGCDGEGDEEIEERDEDSNETFTEAGGEEMVTTISVDKYNSGYIAEDGSGEFRGNIQVGDNVENKNIRGFISFDIRSLPDLPINDARLTISDITKIGDPTFVNELWAYSCYFGSLESGDYELGSSFALCMTFPTEGLTSINNAGGVLKAHLQAYKNNSYDAYQLKLIFPSIDSNNNGQDDYFVINPDNVKLYVSQ